MTKIMSKIAFMTIGLLKAPYGDEQGQDLGKRYINGMINSTVRVLHLKRLISNTLLEQMDNLSKLTVSVSKKKLPNTIINIKELIWHK